jgi:hypothetical protein
MAPVARFEITEDTLRYHTQNVTSDFGIMTSAPLMACSGLSAEETMSFSASSERISGLANVLDGDLLFKFDRNQDCLTCMPIGKDVELNVQAMLVPIDADAKPEVPIGQIPSDALRGALKAASVLATRLKDSSPYSGVRIGNGAARGGYFAGASRYRSSLIPHGLDFLVPRRSLQNASAAIAKAPGLLTVSETETEILLRNSNTRISWLKSDLWPLTLDRMFDHPALATIIVRRVDLLKVGCCLAIPSVMHFQAIPHAIDGTTVIRLSGASSKGIYHDVLRGEWVTPENEASALGWDFSIKSKDFLDIVSALQCDDISLSVTDRGLKIASKDGDNETTTILMGVEAS